MSPDCIGMQGERSAETLSYPLNEIIEARNKLNRGALNIIKER